VLSEDGLTRALIFLSYVSFGFVMKNLGMGKRSAMMN